MRGWGILCALLLAGSSAAVAADEQPICADRPGRSTPTCTAALGHVQIETGLADWSLQKEGGERDTWLVIGETLIRYGLTDHSELQLDVTPWERETSRGPGLRKADSGFGDLTLIYKHRVTAPAAQVQLAFYPYVKVPTANHSLGNGKWEGGLLIPIDAALGKSPFSISVTPEVDWVANGSGRGHHAAMVQVASVGWQATSKLDLSAEIWGQWDWDPRHTTRQASADASAAYLVSNDVQLDGGANFGLNKATPDVQFYAGISKRF
jgi:hypothetical protein